MTTGHLSEEESDKKTNMREAASEAPLRLSLIGWWFEWVNSSENLLNYIFAIFFFFMQALHQWRKIKCKNYTAYGGCLSGSVGRGSDLTLGPDLTPVSLSPVSGSVLTAQSPEPASVSGSPSLSAPPPPMPPLSQSLSPPSRVNKKL